MKDSRSLKKIILLSLIVPILALTAILAIHIKRILLPYHTELLRCTIELEQYDDTVSGLVSGYNYELLERFAGTIGCNIEIRKAGAGNSSLDSLKAGAIDILAVPFGTLFKNDPEIKTVIIDSLSLWVVSREEKKLFKELEGWLEDFSASPLHGQRKSAFLDTYEPFVTARSGIKKSVISPYDSLIIKYSEPLGWDWKLLAAVIYHESQFRINAHSYKGAEGLMQMMPATAEEYGLDNLYNPEESIRGGVDHLLRLQNMFRTHTDSDDDLKRFTLAAYNAGEGNIRKCIHTADTLSLPLRTWENMEDILPLMKFRWKETQYYVSRVYSYYWAFSRIYEDDEATQPEPSGQDPL